MLTHFRKINKTVSYAACIPPLEMQSMMLLYFFGVYKQKGEHVVKEKIIWLILPLTVIRFCTNHDPLMTIILVFGWMQGIYRDYCLSDLLGKLDYVENCYI